MTSPVESRIPEAATTSERPSDFDQITSELRRENPELFNDVKAVLHLSAELERSDLPTDRLQYLEDERRELVEELLEHPEEAILAEVRLLAESYRNRSMSGVDYDGTRSTQFVTRDPERMQADLHFRISEQKNGHSIVTIEVPLRGEMFDNSEPFFITIDTDNGLKIEQRSYARGSYHYQQIDAESPTGKDRLWRFLTYSITATDLLDNRSDDEREFADEQAHRMLRDKILHG